MLVARSALFAISTLILLLALYMQQPSASFSLSRAVSSLCSWPLKGRRLFPGAARSSPASPPAAQHSNASAAAAGEGPLAAAAAAAADTMRAPGGAAVRHIPASSLNISKPTWWLESRFHFSFADYYNPQNMNFGALRVLNDDLVKAKAGFGAHPHRDAEIFSYIVSGELSHKDSMGNYESLPRGCVQYMSAGTGVVHSEMNDGDKTCRFLQVWLTPDQRGHAPQYGSSQYEKADRHNKLLHILGGTGAVPSWPGVEKGRCINLHQDANVFVSESDAGVRHDITLGAGRQAYLVCIEGSMTVATGEAETQLKQQDASELVAGNKPAYLSLQAGPEGAHFMLIEMKQGR